MNFFSFVCTLQFFQGKPLSPLDKEDFGVCGVNLEGAGLLLQGPPEDSMDSYMHCEACLRPQLRAGTTTVGSASCWELWE